MTWICLIMSGHRRFNRFKTQPASLSNTNGINVIINNSQQEKLNEFQFQSDMTYFKQNGSFSR